MDYSAVLLQPEIVYGEARTEKIIIDIDGDFPFCTEDPLLLFEQNNQYEENIEELEILVSKDFENTYKEYYRKLNEMKNLHENWDSYGAEPPNEMAIDNAEIVLQKLYSDHILPDRILPSAEGGVAVSFIRKGVYADFECFNEGEIYIGQSSEKGVDKIEEISIDDLEKNIYELWSFINASTDSFAG